MARTHYEVLGLTSEASDAEIRAAYKAHAAMFHPDRFAQDDERKLKIAHGMMVELNEAYEVLREPARRRGYDATLPEPEPDWMSADWFPEPVAAPPPGPRPSPLEPGEVRTSTLSTAVRERLRARRRSRRNDEYRHRGPGAGRHLLALLLGLLWVPLLLESARIAPWSAGVLRWQIAVTLVAAGAVAYHSVVLVRLLRAPIGRDVLFTPLYVVQGGLERIRFWPYSELLDLETRERANGGADVELSFREGTLRLRLRSQRERQRLSVALESLLARFNAAAERQNWEYVAQHDDLAGIRPLYEPTSPRAQHLRAFGLPALAAAAVAVALVVHASRLNRGAPAMLPVAEVSVEVANVRAAPSTQAEVISKLTRGAQVVLAADSAGGWVPIVHGAGTAFVQDDLLRRTSRRRFAPRGFRPDPLWMAADYTGQLGSSEARGR